MAIVYNGSQMEEALLVAENSNETLWIHTGGNQWFTPQAIRSMRAEGGNVSAIFERFTLENPNCYLNNLKPRLEAAEREFRHLSIEFNNLHLSVETWEKRYKV